MREFLSELTANKTLQLHVFLKLLQLLKDLLNSVKVNCLQQNFKENSYLDILQSISVLG